MRLTEGVVEVTSQASDSINLLIAVGAEIFVLFLGILLLFLAAERWGK